MIENMEELANNIQKMLVDIRRINANKQRKIKEDKFRDKSGLFNDFDVNNYTLYPDEERFISLSKRKLPLQKSMILSGGMNFAIIN